MDAKKTRRTVNHILLLLAAMYLTMSIRCGEPIREIPSDWVLRDGDILLLGSSTLRARFLKVLDCGSTWAHCGIAIAPDVIVHADPESGVMCQTIREYLAVNEVDCVCLLRPNEGDGRIAASFALKSADRKIAFDNFFDYKSNDGMYCTELVLLSWEAAGLAILPEAKKGDRIPPSRLLKSPLLHFVKLGDHRTPMICP